MIPYAHQSISRADIMPSWRSDGQSSSCKFPARAAAPSRCDRSSYDPLFRSIGGIPVNSAMTKTHIPYGRQMIDDDDVAAVAAALRADFLTTGPLVVQFERVFAEKTGAANAVACNSGTAALHLAALALDLAEDKEHLHD